MHHKHYTWGRILNAPSFFFFFLINLIIIIITITTTIVTIIMKLQILLLVAASWVLGRWILDDGVDLIRRLCQLTSIWNNFFVRIFYQNLIKIKFLKIHYMILDWDLSINDKFNLIILININILFLVEYKKLNINFFR